MRAGLRALLRSIRSIGYGWVLAIAAVVRSLISLCRRRGHRGNDSEHEGKRARTECVPIEDPAFLRPDPLIYDQYYLMELGLAVTWENPDFAIFRGGVPVPAHLLEADTIYDVVVRVWNGSLVCPVVRMPVHLSYLSFGVGTTSQFIATEETDIGVKGAVNNPAFVSFRWRTPPSPGHYCLQATLDPVADVEPRNNLGQHNTSVVPTSSPATFTFALRNGITSRREFGFWVDTYALGAVGPCSDDPTVSHRREAYHRGEHPLPAGWSVAVSPAAPVLDPLEQLPVQVTVTPPSGWTGAQTINVHTYYLDNYGIQRLAGGVTVTVTAS